jgi:hypothetical protein
MSKIVERFIFDDLVNSENNCIYTTIDQIHKQTGTKYRTLQDNLSRSNFYFDRKGKFKVEKRRLFMAESMIRKNNKSL